MKSINDVLLSCINLHWLRPDNALWVLSFYQTFAKEIQLATNSNNKTLDLGCGDGTTSYILLDGVLNKSFDVFHDTQAERANLKTDTVRSASGSLEDQKGDFYNIHTENWKSSLKFDAIPPSHFSWGCDWKDALVQKATDLNIYDKGIVHDANSPLPLIDGEVDFVFSTIIYWLANPAKVLTDVSRVLKTKGIFAFSCPNESITNFTLHSMIDKFNYPELASLDRGRHENWKRHANKKEYWESLITNAGFKIVDYKPFHSSLQIAFGETWIRTLLPAYKVLYQRLLPGHKEIWQEFKDEWVMEMYRLLLPFTDENWLKSKNNPPLYHAFFCEKQ